MKARATRRNERARPFVLFVLTCALWLGCGGRGGGPVFQESMTPQWLAANEVILTDYLATLPDQAVGTQIDGILLSDGKRWLAGETYLGEPAALTDGLNVRLLDNGQRVIAYLWLDPGTEPYVLEPCPDGPQKGLRARRAGGGAYAWKALRPEHGLVETLCPPPSWVPADRPSARPPEEEGG